MSGVVFLILRILLTTALYVFLGWSLFIIWRDLKYQREAVDNQLVPSIGLRINEDLNTQEQKYFGTVILIGRDPACQCSLNSEKVSANHARLSFQQNQWWIEDMESTNGSFLNGEPILSPTVVVHGDELVCGDFLLTIVLDSE
jgi:pSer/pThr/pTyr-binding forkhead associated (FHA) protein